MPRTSRSLAHTYAMADQYYGVTHPSMPNYIASIAGDNFGIQDDEDENVVNLDRRNLVDQLEAADVSWNAYMEDLPANKLDRYGPVVNGTEIKLYAKKHNPFVLFDDIKNDPARMEHVRDYSALESDLDRRIRRPVRVDLAEPVQRHARRRLRDGGRAPRDAVPLRNHQGRRQRRGAQAEGRQLGQERRHDDHVSKAWTRKSAIVIVTDENDFTGNTTTGGWENADGLLRLPVRPAQ